VQGSLSGRPDAEDIGTSEGGGIRQPSARRAAPQREPRCRPRARASPWRANAGASNLRTGRPVLPNTNEFVNPKRIVAILGVIIAVRIISALAILVLWLPDLLEHPTLFRDPTLLFPFIASRSGEWHAALFAGVVSSALAIPLTVLLARYFGSAKAMTEAILVIGVGSFLIDIIATTMNFLGTDYLATLYMHSPPQRDLAEHLWRWQEVWRDEGLKTISFVGIGWFTIWLGTQMKGAPQVGFLRFATFGFGIFMLAIGALDAAGLFELGEYGIASGFGHIFYAIWGLALGYWFWFRAPPRETLWPEESGSTGGAA